MGWIPETLLPTIGSCEGRKQCCPRRKIGVISGACHAEIGCLELRLRVFTTAVTICMPCTVNQDGLSDQLQAEMQLLLPREAIARDVAGALLAC